MNLIYADGIDYDTANAGYQFDIGLNNISVGTDIVAGPIVIAGAGGFAGNGVWQNGGSFNAASSTLSITGLYKPNSVNSPMPILGLSSIANTEFMLFINPNNTISVAWGDTIHAGGIFGTSSPLVNLTNSYNVINTIVNLQQAGGSVQIYYNGIRVLNLAGVQTKWTANPATYISHQLIKFRDETIYDNTGTLVINPGTHLKVITDYAISDKLVTWMPSSGLNNYSRINSPIPNNGATYVQTAVLTAQDLYNYPNLPANVNNVYGVKTGIISQHDVGANKIVNIPYNTGLTTNVGNDIGITASTYGYYSDFETLSIFTGIQWTPAEINGTAIGIKLKS